MTTLAPAVRSACIGSAPTTANTPPSALLRRQSKRNQATRRIRIGRGRSRAAGSPAHAAAAGRSGGHDEILAPFGLVDDRHAARRAGQRTSPDLFAVVFV